MSIILRLFVYCCATLICTSIHAETGKKIKAVASFSIIGDMVSNIGGERIELSVLVGPNSDGHVYQPTPRAAKQLANADILFTNGFGFEGWIDRLVAASGFKGELVVTTHGISPLVTATGEIDPHAWQNLANARVYATNIATALVSIDKKHAAFYNANLRRYFTQINLAEENVVSAIASLPPGRRSVITSHDAFDYFEAAYGLHFAAPQGLSTNAEATATDVAALIRQIRAEKTPALFAENVTDARLIQQITRETGAKIGGTLYSDALSEKHQPADTYLNLMQYNARLLVEALSN